MPYTRLQRHTALKRKGAMQRRRNSINRGRAIILRTTHYKRFCDICFEFWVRWRDNWTDVLDGRKFAQGDYQHYQACHYFGRGSLSCRYNPMNCHGQSSGHNWAESTAAKNVSSLVYDRTMLIYRRFLVKKYGEQAVAELEEESLKPCHRSIPEWQDLSVQLYKQAKKINARALSKRLASVYSKGEEQGILIEIFKAIGLPPDGLGKKGDKLWQATNSKNG